MVTVVRVLVVDDAEDLRELVGMVVEREPGWTVVGEAGDGRTAIEVAARVRPDLVLLDMAMPVMDGLTALPPLRALLPGAALVVLTAFPREQVWGEARARGADGCLEKTGMVGRLVADLEEVLSRRRVPGQGRVEHRADPRVDHRVDHRGRWSLHPGPA